MTNTPFNDLPAGNILVEIQVQDDYSKVVESFESNQFEDALTFVDQANEEAEKQGYADAGLWLVGIDNQGNELMELNY